MQRERVQDQYPWTWEIPLAVVCGVPVVTVAACQLGRSVANWFAGAGWLWPPPDKLVTSIPVLLAGDAAAGLSGVQYAASAAALWGWLSVVGLLTVTASTLVCVWAWRQWGPGRMRGMATVTEAHELLGEDRLWKVRHVVRPDLYPVGRRAQQMTAAQAVEPRTNRAKRFDPAQVGWRIGAGHQPRSGDLWCPWDRTAGVIGPQGSGKTLDLLTPALIHAPGAALVTLTKPDDLLLSLPERSKDGRPCVVLDPFGLVPGLPELVWDPIAGCVDRMVSERRAKAFTAGTIHGTSHGSGDAAARFYAAEAAKVLMAYFHAAALTGKTLDDLLAWVAKPLSTSQPEEILRRHPYSDPLWAGLLQGALRGDERTSANTITTVQQAMSLFFQDDIRRRCVPSERRPATNVADIIHERGTIYLLGREDPYASASPLMTAVAEHVLDTAIQQANGSQFGRLCPPMLACLDELPSTAPLPTLRTRMANERALGLSFIYAAQTFRQLAAIFGEQEARALVGLTNVLVWFGGSKDVSFNQEVSDLVGRVRVPRSSWQMGAGRGRTIHSEEIPILRPEELRQLPDKQALVIAENARPIIARLHRCIEGRDGQRLLAQQRALREQLAAGHTGVRDVEARTAAALVEAQRHGW